VSLQTNQHAYSVQGTYPVTGIEQPETLREAVQHALTRYLDQLDGTPPSDLHHLVIQQVEQPLFETVMSYTGGNQSKAAHVLGISRSTLRKKLAQYEIE